MNILFLLSQLEVTGAETYVESLSAYLKEQGCNIFIASDTFTRKVDAKIFSVPLHNRSFSSRLSNIKEVKKIISENNIDVVHANSRASAWVGNFACKKLKIPFVVTIHGLSGMRKSKKLIPALGDRTIAVCEEIMENTLADYPGAEKKIQLIRNGLDISKYRSSDDYYQKTDPSFTISYLGRVSGPKLDIVKKLISVMPQIKAEIPELKFNIIGGQNFPEILQSEIKKINSSQNEEFIYNSGYTNDVRSFIEQSDLMIASGRSAIESALLIKPLIWWGEAVYGGLLTNENIKDALRTNFGDCSSVKNDITDKDLINNLISYYRSYINTGSSIRNEIAESYDLNLNSKKIYDIYMDLISVNNNKILSEPLPIILYHKVVEKAEVDSKVGIFVTAKDFEKQLSYLKKKNYRTLTFYDVQRILKNEMLSKENDIILTFDDGYKNNYSTAFPILKKYGSKCVIFFVTDTPSNAWDKDKNEAEDILMTDPEIAEMEEYGIEFGSHTLTHPHLTEISLEEAKREICASFEVLSKKLRNSLISFAYPYGECNSEIKEIVSQCGYQFGVATDSGPIHIKNDLLEIRRQILFSHTSMIQFRKKISKWYPRYKLNKKR